MKNYVVVAAGTSLVVASALVFALQFFQGVRSPAMHYPEVERLAAELKEMRESMAALRTELRGIRSNVDSQVVTTGSAFVAADIDAPNELSQRVFVLEETVDELARASGAGGYNAGSAHQNELVRSLREPSNISQPNENPVATNLFEADSGKPLGSYADSIGEALHTSRSINVEGMDCRETICKVTYSNPSSSTPEEIEDSNWELMQNLSDGLAGQALDIRHSKDFRGHEVMYIQLR